MYHECAVFWIFRRRKTCSRKHLRSRITRGELALDQVRPDIPHQVCVGDQSATGLLRKELEGLGGKI